MSENHAYISTSDWGVLGGVRIRRWTNSLTRTEQVFPQIEDPRQVDVRITSWVGVSPGARHFHLTIREADNMYWCEDKNAWVRISSSVEARGFLLHGNFEALENAKKVANFVLDTVFGKKRTKRRKMWRIKWEGV